jgi:hypothetical protein
MTEHINTAWV